MPNRPIPASCPKSSRGKACASSIAAACGAMRWSQKRAKVSRTCCCSGFSSKFMPFVVDEFEQHPIHRLRMHERELAVPKRARAANERVVLRLQFVHRRAGTVHVERNQHHAFAALVDELGDVA